MQTARPSRRPVYPWIIAAALLAGLMGGVLWTRDTRTSPPSLSGALWHGGGDASPLLVFITKEERARTVPIIGRTRSFRFEPYHRYELVTRRIPSGEVVHQVRLGDLKHVVETREPQILGVAGDVLWVWRDSLEGYRLPDLTLQVTPSTLLATAPASREVLPVEPAGYRMAGTLGVLVARGRDARLYRIDAQPPTLASIEHSALPPTSNSTRVEDRFDYLTPPRRAMNAEPSGVMQRSFLTRTGLWYALLSESERAGLAPWPSAEDRPFGAVARTLHSTSYRLDNRGYPEIVPKNVKPMGSERLIQAGFLVRGARAVWDVADPSSSLALAKSRLGESEPWELVRLTRDGVVLWRTSLGMSTTWSFLDLGTHAAFYGPMPPAAPEARREQVVWIDAKLGRRHTLSIATGEVFGQ